MTQFDAKWHFTIWIFLTIIIFIENLLSIVRLVRELFNKLRKEKEGRGRRYPTG